MLGLHVDPSTLSLLLFTTTTANKGDDDEDVRGNGDIVHISQEDKDEMIMSHVEPQFNVCIAQSMKHLSSSPPVILCHHLHWYMMDQADGENPSPSSLPPTFIPVSSLQCKQQHSNCWHKTPPSLTPSHTSTCFQPSIQAAA